MNRANRNVVPSNNGVVRTFQGLSTVYQIIFGALVIFMIGFLIYWGVSSRGSSMFSSRLNPIIVREPVNAFDNNLGERALRVPMSNSGMEYTYSFWMYVADWSYNYGQKKYIFIKGNPDAGSSQWSPAIWLGESLNTLNTSMALFPDNGSQNGTVENCSVSDIPLQKWVHVAYVLNNRNVDIYINGKLEKACMLDAVPNVNNGPLHVTPADPALHGDNKSKGGFYGQLANFQYFTTALNPSRISQIYLDGPYAIL